MSDYCLRIWQNGLNGSEYCFPESIMENGTGAILGTWCIINAIIGFFGNLLTLVAIPYASFNKRYINIFDISINIWCIFFYSFNPKISWSTNVFILNLALADLLNCVINIPIYLIHTLYQKWPWGLSSCKFSAYIRFSLSFVSWISGINCSS